MGILIIQQMLLTIFARWAAIKGAKLGVVFLDEIIDFSSIPREN